MELFRPPAGTHPGIRSSFTTYYTPVTSIAGTGTGAIAANTLYFLPHNLPGGLVDRIGIEVTSGSAGAARLGIYANENGAPGALILDCGTVDTTSNAIVEASFTALRLPEWVWAAVVSNATPTLRVGGQSASNIVGASTPSSTSRGLSRSFTYDTLPATGAATGVSNVAPIVFFRKS